MGTVRNDAFEMPAGEEWFPLGTISPVGVELMMESAEVVAKKKKKKAVEKLGVVTIKGVCYLIGR